MTASREKHEFPAGVALLLICAMTLLGGCSGGALGNLIPLPKMLSGSVRNNVYYARNDLFSIDTPFPQGSDLYTYAEIKEKYEDKQGFVMFHSSVAGNEYYHVEVERLPESSGNFVDLETAANDAEANIEKMQANAGHEPLVLVKEEPWKARYTTGLIRLYQQKVPAADVTTDSGKKSFTAYHLMYVTRESDKIAAVLADWLIDADEAAPPGKMDIAGADSDPVKNAFTRNERAWKFINSINLDVTATRTTSK